MRINNRRGRRLTVILIGGPHEGVLSSADDDAQANMIWMLTDYGRAGSEFIKVASDTGRTTDPTSEPNLRPVRYRVTELVELETEIRLTCHYQADQDKDRN